MNQHYRFSIAVLRGCQTVCYTSIHVFRFLQDRHHRKRRKEFHQSPKVCQNIFTLHGYSPTNAAHSKSHHRTNHSTSSCEPAQSDDRETVSCSAAETAGAACVDRFPGAMLATPTDHPEISFAFLSFPSVSS